MHRVYPDYAIVLNLLLAVFIIFYIALLAQDSHANGLNTSEWFKYGSAPRSIFATVFGASDGNANSAYLTMRNTYSKFLEDNIKLSLESSSQFVDVSSLRETTASMGLVVWESLLDFEKARLHALSFSDAFTQQRLASYYEFFTDGLTY